MMDKLIGRRVILTGGAGFIGSHMLRRLLAEEVSGVVIIDSLAYGIRENLPQDPRIELITLPLESDELPSALAHIAPCDYLIHLAARKHNQRDHGPAELFAGNIEGTRRIIEFAARLGVQRAVYASSLYAYGRWSGPPMQEGEVPGPDTLYGISKLAGEHLFAWGRRTHGLSYAIVRYFFVYGPRQYPGLGYKSVIVSNFERMRSGAPAIIRGDGAQTLDYIYVDDAVEGTLRALCAPQEGEVFNIGSGSGVSITDLTECMFAIANKKPAITFEPQDETHGSSRVGNVGKARRVLGFSARTSLEKGLAQTYAWLSNRSDK